MRTIKRKYLRPGMVLAVDAKALNGRILVARGKKLTKKHLEIFMKWGLGEATIMERRGKSEISPDATGSKTASFKEKRISVKLPPEIPSVSKKKLQKIQDEISDLFQHNNIEHPAVQELMRLGVLYTLKRHPGMKTFDVY
ncbi:MAG: hypothetical protein IIA62_02065 [Nitrospinae bacterium]|nr:hypothetical protein [Nitrospinota bacterium]